MSTSPSRISFVTTYPPMTCAIGTYSQKLLRAMVASHSNLHVDIIAEDKAEASDEPGISSRPVYARNEDYREKILAAALANRSQVVHFQYAPDLLGRDERLPGLLHSLKEAGIRTIVTLHTVYADSFMLRLASGMSPADFHRALGREADGIVVHHRSGMADLLVSQGLDSNKISVIPHGTDLMPHSDQAESRRRLGIAEDAFLFTFFGFIHVQKNVHSVVEAFARTARDLPGSRLLVAGKAWGDRPYNHAYIGIMKARKFLSGLGERMVFMNSYIPTELVPHIFAASDVLLLPHWQKYGSASGVFHQAIGAQKPILVARGPKFEDGLKHLANLPVLTPSPLNVGEWKAGMRALYSDPELRRQACDIMSDYAHNTAWPIVAEATHALYAGILS